MGHIQPRWRNVEMHAARRGYAPWDDAAATTRKELTNGRTHLAISAFAGRRQGHVPTG